MLIEKKNLNNKKFNFFKKDEKTNFDSNALLSCHRVTKSFGALVAVNKLSFNVPKGIVFGIGGPNGAGKTTLFDVISGIQKIDNGEIRFNNQIITNIPSLISEMRDAGLQQEADDHESFFKWALANSDLTMQEIKNEADAQIADLKKMLRKMGDHVTGDEESLEKQKLRGEVPCHH